MRRGFVSVEGRDIHYCRAGSGPPVIFLHASPMSSASLAPRMQAAVDAGYTAIGIDTPGYGFSDPLSQEPTCLGDYLPTFMAAIDAFGVDQFAIYGTATGAQIAIELAKLHADRVAYLVLDNCAHFSDEEREKIFTAYLPDLSPTNCGSHIAKAWTNTHDLFCFFPWCFHEEQYRLKTPMPPAPVMHTVAMDYLRCASGYSTAYRLAFENENYERLLPVTVPGVLLRWEHSMVGTYTDVLIEMGLPESIQPVVFAGGPEAPAQAMVAALKANYTAADAPDEKLTLGANQYCDVPGGQIRIRKIAGEGRPILVLHDAGGAGDLTLPIGETLATGRPVIVPDLAGAGASDPIFEDSEADIALAHARTLIQVMDALGIDSADIVSRYTSGVIAAEMALAAPERVHAIAMTSPVLFDAEEGGELAANYCPDFSPRNDGTHLMSAWHFLRDQSIFFPWYDRRGEAALQGDAWLDPDMLHTRLIDLFDAGPRYALNYKSAYMWPAEKLANVQCPVVFASNRRDPMKRCHALGLTHAMNAQSIDLPDSMADWGTALLGYLSES